MKTLLKRSASQPGKIAARRTIRRRRRNTSQRRVRNRIFPEQHLDNVRPNRRLVQAASNRARQLVYLPLVNIPVDHRRSVICDGESIAYDDVSRTFKARRIERAVAWFENLGHSTVAVVPSYIDQIVADGHYLESLYNQGKLIRMESDRGTAEQNVSLERQILSKALVDNAAIISEREFEVVYRENVEFRTIVEDRVVGFCFFKEEIFIPVDPYGRAGPWLVVILQK